jgi:hypothetical protein
VPISPRAIAPRLAEGGVARSRPQVLCVPACDCLLVAESLSRPAEKQVVPAQRA